MANNSTSNPNNDGPSQPVKILMAVTLAVFALMLVNSTHVFDHFVNHIPQPVSEEVESTTSEFGATASENEVFSLVETMPTLIGGLAGLQNRVQYPKIAQRAGIEGRVFLQFVVDTDGQVIDAVVVRGIGSGCDEAALSAVKKTKFKPGKQRGKPVKVQVSIPVVFKLQ